MPPIQAEAILQNSRPLGSASMSVRMEAPVVVKPDTLSKNALTRVNSPPYIIYGMAPKMQDSIQENVTMKKPSRFPMLLCFGTKIRGNRPVMAVSSPA